MGNTTRAGGMSNSPAISMRLYRHTARRLNVVDSKRCGEVCSVPQLVRCKSGPAHPPPIVGAAAASQGRVGVQEKKLALLKVSGGTSQPDNTTGDSIVKLSLGCVLLLLVNTKSKAMVS